MAKPHAPRTEKVVGIGFQPGFDPYKVYYHLFALICFLLSVVEETMGVLA